MRNIVVIISILLTFSSFEAKTNGPADLSKISDEIAYSITIDSIDHKTARVTASFIPKDNILYMEPGADQLPKRWATFVHDLKAVDSSGKSVDIQELPDAKWKLDLSEPKPITLSYKIALDHENYKWSGGIDGIAYARDQGVFYSGRTLLILNGKEWRKINVRFVLPKNWKVTTPWQPTKLNSFRVENMTDLKRSMIFAGTHTEISFRRDKFELVFAIGGEELVAQKEEFRKLAEGVLDYYIGLMGGIPNPSAENKFSRAIVIINPSESTDGEVIGNNISILIAKNGDKMARLFSRFIFAHEFFHLWNGKSFAPVADNTEWFKEGVTNYYALKALHRVGFLTESTFLESLNTIFYRALYERRRRRKTVDV